MNCDYNYSKLKGKVRELEMTLNEYAEYIGITEQTLNKRFKNQRPFTQPEIAKTMQLFDEPVNNIHLYFFYKKSCEKQNKLVRKTKKLLSKL